MPLSYQGFGPVAILIMVLCLAAGQLYRYIRSRRSGSAQS